MEVVMLSDFLFLFTYSFFLGVSACARVCVAACRNPWVRECIWY